MEEQRISRMYLTLVTRWFGRRWYSLFPRGIMRSRAAFLAGLAALILVPSVGWYLHTLGRFHKAKTDLGVSEAPPPPALPRPGGAEALVLTRKPSSAGTSPEFLSVTMVPGLGMGVLQITADVPGRGEVPLLAAPSLQALADNPSGPRRGVNDDHGSIELPWAGALVGAVSPLGTTLETLWHGRQLSVSRDPQERSGLAEGGMLAVEPADSTQTGPLGDGVQGSAEFRSTDFGGHWPSRTNVVVTAQLAAHALDLTVTARNVGSDPEPMGIGWMPRFVLGGGDPGRIELRLPNGDLVALSGDARGTPTGRFAPPDEALSRFQGHAAPLGSKSIDATFAHLRPALLDNGSEAELRDLNGGFGLRLIAASPAIRSLHVVAPGDGGYVSLGMQTNYPNGLGAEWNGDGIATLAPGESIEWKVRLEIFAISKH